MSDPRRPYDINQIYEEMTLDLIASMKRNLSRHEVEEEHMGFRFDQWQLAKLRQLQAYRKANQKILGKASQEADKLVDEVMQQSFDFGEDFADKTISKIIAKAPKSFKSKKPKQRPEVLPKAPSESDFFGMNAKKLQALQDVVKGDLKKAEQGVLRKMDDVYRQTIFRAEVHMAAGAKTLNQAIDMATKDFLARGIDTIVYSNGRRVPITSYAEMALRTASQRATLLGEGQKRAEWGIHTVLMSSHGNCSPMCLPWQGKVYIDDVYSGGKPGSDTSYPLLSRAMANGAFHPHCRHNLSTFYPGISRMPKQVDEEAAKENYEAEQQQRYMERQIRMYKRLEAGSVDEQNQTMYGHKVKEWRGRLLDHLEKYPHLRRDRYRETNNKKNGIIRSEIQYRRFSSSEQVTEWSDKVTPSWLISLTEDEKEGIRKYSGSSYSDINRCLRKGITDPHWQKYIDSISNGLQKFELKEGIITYRGLQTNAFDGLEMSDIIGTEITDAAYMSTSLLGSGAFSGNVQLELHVPPGKHGASIIPLSIFPGEYEFLLDKGTKYVVRKADREQGILKLIVEVLARE